MGVFVVTGVAGFIGSHLAEALLRRGDSVIGVDSFTDYYARALKLANVEGVASLPKFELREADLALERLDQLVAGVDGVFHLAAQPGVRGSWGESFEIYVRQNVTVTQKVFEAAAEAGARVVYASSSSVYGDAATYPTPESTTPAPISPYGVTKLCCEHLAGAYRASAGLDAVGLRYFTVYGPRQRPDMAFTKLVNALRDGEPFSLFGDGSQSRDVTYVADAVSATMAVMDKCAAHGVYNVGGGSETKLNDVIALLEDASGRHLDLTRMDTAKGDVRRTAADTTRIRSDIGWTPTVDVSVGIRNQLAWALEPHRGQ
jgi:UDP-glucuronate 4-epimerase